MREQNGKHGRKSSRHNGDRHMRKGKKRHQAASRNRARNRAPSARTVAIEQVAAPLVKAPTLPAAPFTLPPSTRFADGTPAATSVGEPTLPASPTTTSETRAEPTAEPNADGRGSRMRRCGLVLLALAVAATAAVALARTCDPNVDPTQDDVAAPDSCSDDAASCVAWV
jgi:hypothetical protein